MAPAEDEEPILYDPAQHAEAARASAAGSAPPRTDPRMTQSSAQQLASLHAGHRRVDGGCSAVLAAVLVPRYLAPWLGIGWYLIPVGIAAAVITGVLVARFGNG